MYFRQYVTQHLEAYAKTPGMWGSNETIEALSIQLLDLEIQHYRPEVLEAEPRLVIDTYTREVSRRYGSGVLPLHARTPDQFDHAPKVLDFSKELLECCQAVRTQLWLKLRY